MPIFDQGYQHWDGTRSGLAWRSLTIARQGIRGSMKGKWTRLFLIGTLAVAVIPALLLATFLALWGLLEQQTDYLSGFIPPGFLPPDVLANPREYRSSVWTLAFSTFLWIETGFAMILVAQVGPGLISQDLRFNAIPLYLSRPLRRADYFLGKLGVIAAYLGGLMIAPAVFAYILGVAFSLDAKVIPQTYRILLGSVAYGLVTVFSVGMLVLAISSMSRRSRNVAAAWLGIWIVGNLSAAALGGPLLRLEWGPVVSIHNDLLRVREVLLGTKAAWEPIGKAFDALTEKMEDLRRPSFFGIRGRRRPRPEPPPDQPPKPNQYYQLYPWTWSAGVLAGLAVVSALTLSTRVRSLDRLK